MPSTPSSTGGGGSTTNNPLAPRAQEMQTRDNPFADSVSYQYPPDGAPTASVVPSPTTVAPPASHAIPVAHTLGVSGGASSAAAPSSSSNTYPGRGGGRGGRGEEGFLYQGQLPLQQSPPPTRQWANPSLDWLRDGESCWWSFWCPLLLFARTTSRFELHPQPCTFASMVIGAAVVSAILSALLGPIMTLISFVGFAVLRAHYRGKLRHALGVAGGWCEDFTLHLFCSPCAVAQEARQANVDGKPSKEFCTGEELAPLSSDPTAAGNLSFFATLRKLSRCSSLLLNASLLLFLLAILFSSPGSALILTLAVLQPVVVLYIVYWRKHKKEASLDTIIKLFAVGFFFTSQAAAMTEPVVELLLMAVAGAAGLLPAFNADTTEEDIQTWARAHLSLVIVMCFCMAFFVAAMVEELFKYLLLRYCTLGGPMRSPHTILIYLISGSLGFACAENIVYAFSGGSSLSPSPSGAAMNKMNLFVDELAVLALRALMPVHVICAALQALQWIKTVAEDTPMSTFRLLFPAILLHGTFDFSLMAAGALAFGLEWDEKEANVIALAIALGMTLLGFLITYRLWCAQQERINGDWFPVGDVEINEGGGGGEERGLEGGRGEEAAPGSITRPLFQQQGRQTAAARDPSSSLPPSSSGQGGRNESGLLSATQALEEYGGRAEVV